MTAVQLAERLRAAGIGVGKVCEPTNQSDGEIVLCDNLAVWVGSGLFTLALKTPDETWRLFDPRCTAEGVLSHLRRLAQDPTLQDIALRQALRRIP